MINERIIKEAKKKYDRIEKIQEDLRFIKTIGKFIDAGLLLHSNIPRSKEAVTIDDALFVSEIEPRILELMPALLLKKPNFFIKDRKLPDDLKQILKDIKRGMATKDFRGIPPAKYLYWLNFIGHNNKNPTLLKSFRFSQNDLKILNFLKDKYLESEIGVIRMGMMLLMKEK